MGLEARRVPPDFRHPKTIVEGLDGKRREVFAPCHDRKFSEASAEHAGNRERWIAGTHPDQARHADTPKRYEDWAGPPPDPGTHLPETFDRRLATAWCLYENVTEGTPVTPIFKTRDELLNHMVTKGAGPWGRMSREAAEAVLTTGAPSGSMDADGMHDTVQTMERQTAGL